MKACSFFGHRDTAQTEELKQSVRETVERLIVEERVDTFLFGSRSTFDALCHECVTFLQQKYPHIRRIMYTCRSEYAVKKGEKERVEKGWSNLLKKNVTIQDYDGEMMSDRVYSAGKASYVERNQEMINASDYCIFYYNPQYLPTRGKCSKIENGAYQSKSGTALAFAYAERRKKSERGMKIINLFLK